ncbi:MAG: uracil-DNA glycosylase family protein [Crocinitomicaceae bacterium]
MKKVSCEKQLHKEILKCQICKDFLPNLPKPILRFSKNSKIIIIGQAPGNVVHQKEVSFDDKSGDTLRKWMGVTREEFYNVDNFAIVPMGFCYPGKGKTGGDAPPRMECAPHWHHSIFELLKNVELVLLIGNYAIKYYLRDGKKKNLTETVRNFEDYLETHFPIVHPSPLNFRWHSKNEWFKQDVVPILRLREIINRE